MNTDEVVAELNDALAAVQSALDKVNAANEPSAPTVDAAWDSVQSALTDNGWTAPQAEQDNDPAAEAEA